ncbi:MULTISPECIES: FtsW/RodA/SpoVE family cell cycle protein [Cryobacterium]|uniref:FtsW/RodA/SpoVE family cell cycle protein n=1 Tax=Cryobacterium glucosi TaxID=1259175 RepID=A0ABY2IRT2_9MICO|nr:MULTISPECIES: FtsW/RodA/SpoVE family cell cycle protein [Cryobacterium]MDY7529648.1 FtsW/RodA/SpoVE family cell cycle protein [Cryobacterium sp. 10C2]MDY7558213.1 FtsW/RodA/SpoVE family cell cycle protein [Cryobacterium sp. 10C3]MEB0202136.1 FtsW/RodA/SpoVE family cell cycle protein [Cryobacterium sp. 5I3]MEB0291280.1 FtsW/RodA/SpoVE family cell cycle protein [Cryobacterium sp. 10C2]TFB95830.1 FtsW/RodA/SpoVE family cell cycle protein [Cryobacterium sp. MDB2-A-1]
MSNARATDAPTRAPKSKPGSTRRLHLPQKMRNVELFLLIVACGINASAVVLVQLGALGHIDTTLVVLGAGLSGLVLCLHIVLRFVARDADPFILPIATLLNGIGIAMIYRIDIANGDAGWDSAAVRQTVWSGLAIACAITVMLVIRNHRVLFRYTYVSGFVAVVLLLLPLVPGLGREVSGARVWIGIGSFATFQPGEIAKIALAIFFAGYLVRNRDSLSMVGRRVLWMKFPRLRDLGPILVLWALSMSVIIFQRDLGTALLYFGLFLVMLYIATGRLSWVLLGMTLFIGGAIIASQTLDYVHGRFQNWLDALNPDVYNADGGSYQLVQGLFGLAKGGLLGTGLGQGRPEITPVPQSDYIIASLGEELGLAGLFAILALYLLFVARGIRIGFAGHDDFGKLLGVGLSFVVALQCFIVIGGVTRVIPLTGLTTPFLAAGGSSLVANWIIVALLLRLSDTIRNQPRLVV